MLQKEDTYIHFTKYGGVNKGIVKDITYTLVIDTENKVSFKRYSIITNNNIILCLDGSDGQIYKVENDLTKEYCDDISILGETAHKMKENTINNHKKLNNGI